MNEGKATVELLAPAGNAEGFYGAVHGGADAVYLAGNRFGARAYAENFTTEELVKCIRYGHLLGRKIYLTVNTLLKQQELDELYGYLLPFYEEGLDAVIVQDLGVLRFIRENFPGLKIHISTQMTVCSSYGISLLQGMGAERVVPARELSLGEITAIKKALPSMEIECFIHGAMCYCYSGQCLFSSVLGGRSGNRGRCAQPCRLPYTVELGEGGRESGHVLSLKDMCTVWHMPKLIEAGIDSFKIEGRMKKPEYTAGVTAIYRRLIDNYYELREKRGPGEAAEAYFVDKKEEKALKSLYIRSEIQDGYYFRHNGREMITLDSPAYSASDEKLLNDIHEKYVAQVLKLPVQIRADFRAGEPAKVMMQYSPGREQAPDAIYHEESMGTVSYTAVGDIVGKAQKQPISEANVSDRLSRLGDSAFHAEKLQIFLGEECFYPLGKINELRREAAAGLEKEILSARGYGKEKACSERTDFEETFAEGTYAERANASCRLMKPQEEKRPYRDRTVEGNRAQKAEYTVSIRTAEQLEAVVKWTEENGASDIRRIYVDGDLAVQKWKQTAVLCRRLLEHSGCELYMALPYILRETDGRYLEEAASKAKESGLFKGFLARSMDGIGFLREKAANMVCRTDAGVYVWNRSAEEELSALAEGFCMPYELRAAEQRKSGEGLPCEKIVYSRIPMMITANCLRRTAGKCRKEYGTVKDESELSAVLKDRYQKEFPVVINCLHCMNIIYNSIPFSLYRDLPKWKGRADLRMDFTTESPDQTGRLLDAFIKGSPLPEGEYTAGYEKRGVE